MNNRFIQRNGTLEDAKIVAALKQAATQYANGEIAEVYDMLIDIVSAIEDFDKRMEVQLG